MAELSIFQDLKDSEKTICGIPPKNKHTGSVIFLHGLGDIGNTWIEYFKTIARDDINYIFPTAPNVPVTVNGGHAMPSWFDIYELVEHPKKENSKDIFESCAFLESIVCEETKKCVPPERIIIGGISQGGATALITALTTKIKLAGVIFLSSFVTLKQDIPNRITGVNRDTPLFHAHGNKDRLISIEWCHNTQQLLQEWVNDIEYKTYDDLGHWVNEVEFRDLGLWIDKVLPPVIEKNESK